MVLKSPKIPFEFDFNAENNALPEIKAIPSFDNDCSNSSPICHDYNANFINENDRNSLEISNKEFELEDLDLNWKSSFLDLKVNAFTIKDYLSSRTNLTIGCLESNDQIELVNGEHDQFNDIIIDDPNFLTMLSECCEINSSLNCFSNEEKSNLSNSIDLNEIDIELSCCREYQFDNSNSYSTNFKKSFTNIENYFDQYKFLP